MNAKKPPGFSIKIAPPEYRHTLNRINVNNIGIMESFATTKQTTNNDLRTRNVNAIFNTGDKSEMSHVRLKIDRRLRRLRKLVWIPSFG
jgi:hypothetical protein